MRTWLWLGALGILGGCQCQDTQFSTCRVDKDCDLCERCSARRCAQIEEICDDLNDNDCDGQTDENCGTACYGVICDRPPQRYCLDREHLIYYRVPGHCGPFGVCGYDAVEVECAGGCRDGACAEDVCIGLVCPGDRNPCTDDGCDPVLGCTHVDNTQPCEDGDACTVGDICFQGRCMSGDAKDCDDRIECTLDDCDWATGCGHQPRDELCDDGDPCTTDACDLAAGCVHGFHQEPCDDGDECTMGEACAEGICAGGLPKDADGDGYVDKYCGGDDCEDDNPESHPGLAEVCDGADNDCDGLTDVLGIDATDPCRVQAICVGGVPVDCPAAAGPTVAPALIDSQVLWCAAGSPYIVERSLVVTEEGSLTVGPCVEVRVADGAAIYVNGLLRVLAESGRPAVFTSNSMMPRRGSWLGIEVRSLPSANAILSGAVVEYADCGLRSHAAKEGMDVSGSVFRENFVGLEGKIFDTDRPSPKVKATFFTNNECGARTGRFDYYRSTFRGNHIALGDWGYNSGNFLYMCDFINNAVGVDNYMGRIVNCVIAGNTEAGIQPLSGWGMPYQIIGSTIEGNGIGIVQDIQVGFDRFPEMKKNIVCQNLKYDIKMETWHPLDATGNYWCTTNPDEIAARIYDIHDDSSLGEAVFSPFLSEAP